MRIATTSVQATTSVIQRHSMTWTGQQLLGLRNHGWGKGLKRSRVPLTRSDGMCGDDDSCPLDPFNDIDDDGICGDVDMCVRVYI